MRLLPLAALRRDREHEGSTNYCILHIILTAGDIAHMLLLIIVADEPLLAIPFCRYECAG
jgi:hypothetical protein